MKQKMPLFLQRLLSALTKAHRESQHSTMLGNHEACRIAGRGGPGRPLSLQDARRAELLRGVPAQNGELNLPDGCLDFLPLRHVASSWGN